MSQFTSYQLSFSTAEIESLYFSGVKSAPTVDRQRLLPQGTYRVIAGELFRLVDGVPASAVPAETEGA